MLLLIFLGFFSNKVQVWCRISFGVSFFSDVYARQRVALHALLKYHIVVLGVLSNRLLLRVV